MEASTSYNLSSENPKNPQDDIGAQLADSSGQIKWHQLARAIALDGNGSKLEDHAEKLTHRKKTSHFIKKITCEINNEFDQNGIHSAKGHEKVNEE